MVLTTVGYCNSKGSTYNYSSLSDLADKCPGKENSPFVYRLSYKELKKISITTEDFYCIFFEEGDDLVTLVTCGPRNFCAKGNPCIRKCCGLNQKLVKNPDNPAPATCEPYEGTLNVTFHNMRDNQVSDPPEVKVSGEEL